MQIPPADTPIVCDVSTAPDSVTARTAEYRRLFATLLIGRERTAAGIRFRLRAGDGVAAWVRDLSAREHACRAFMVFEVTTVGGEIHWDVAVSDNDDARAVLDEYYRLPESVTEDPAVLAERYRTHGLAFVNGDPLTHHARPGDPVRQG